MANTSVLEGLIQALHRLPGVGVKSASRMAYHLLQHDREGAKLIADALQTAVAEVQHCEQCNTFTTQPICLTCADTARDTSRLCVVESPADQSAV
jgi:recombination protein RecR